MWGPDAGAAVIHPARVTKDHDGTSVWDALWHRMTNDLDKEKYN
jgi:hypothetical protein